jgi:hypothetical protein
MPDSINDVDTTLTQIRNVLILIGLMLGENGDERTAAKEKLWDLARHYSLVSKLDHYLAGQMC